jgi:glycolate oxidase
MCYKTFDETDYKKMLEMIGDPSRVLFKEEISRDYGHDELGGIFYMPDVVIKATTAMEISNIMKYSFEHRIPVTPRGSGTGLVGGAVPVKKGVVIDLSLMNRILELDEENLTVTAEPGVGTVRGRARLFLSARPRRKNGNHRG